MPVVFIIEDEPGVRSVAEAILKNAGHCTLSASSVAEALAIIQSEQHFDVLFTDMTLLDELEGGLRVSQAAARARPGLPVIYTSGKALSQTMVEAFVKPRTFLPKPYTRRQLTDAVSRLMELAQEMRGRTLDQ